MKKTIAVFAAFAMLMAASGCAQNKSDAASSENSSALAKTTAVSEQFQGKQVADSYQSVDYAYSPTFDNISDHTDFAVKAVVKGIDYLTVGSDKNGKEPWTVIHVDVKESLKGEISNGELDIYTYGGYISEYESLGEASMRAHGNYASEEEFLKAKKQKQNSIIHYVFNGSELPEISREYVFCLTKRNKDFMPKGTYELLFGAYGTLEVQADGTLSVENYESADNSGKGNLTYTIDDVKNKLK